MLEALTNAVDVAWERRYNDSTYWSFVVEAVNDLVSEEEMKKFKALCFSGEFGLGDYDDDEVNDLMNRLKGGSNEDDEEDSDNMPAELVEDSREFQDARDGYLAREMWKGYREWIRNRPGEQERFREFMVSSVCCFYNSVSVFLPTFILRKLRYAYLAANKQGAKVYRDAVSYEEFQEIMEEVRMEGFVVPPAVPPAEMG